MGSQRALAAPFPRPRPLSELCTRRQFPGFAERQDVPRVQGRSGGVAERKALFPCPWTPSEAPQTRHAWPRIPIIRFAEVAFSVVEWAGPSIGGLVSRRQPQVCPFLVPRPPPQPTARVLDSPPRIFCRVRDAQEAKAIGRAAGPECPGRPVPTRSVRRPAVSVPGSDPSLGPHGDRGPGTPGQQHSVAPAALGGGAAAPAARGLGAPRAPWSARAAPAEPGGSPGQRRAAAAVCTQSLALISPGFQRDSRQGAPGPWAAAALRAGSLRPGPAGGPRTLRVSAFPASPPPRAGRPRWRVRRRGLGDAAGEGSRAPGARAPGGGIAGGGRGRAIPGGEGGPRRSPRSSSAASRLNTSPGRRPGRDAPVTAEPSQGVVDGSLFPRPRSRFVPAGRGHPLSGRTSGIAPGSESPLPGTDQRRLHGLPTGTGEQEESKLNPRDLSRGGGVGRGSPEPGSPALPCPLVPSLAPTLSPGPSPAGLLGLSRAAAAPPSPSLFLSSSLTLIARFPLSPPVSLRLLSLSLPFVGLSSDLCRRSYLRPRPCRGTHTGRIRLFNKKRQLGNRVN
ncbi:uncharacterized protein LOC144368157 [Ictidomys tridecemlineatus]